MNKIKLSILTTALICSISSFTHSKNTELTGKEVVIYHNGDILTMEGDAPQYTEAIVTNNGKIVFVGKLADAKKQFVKAEQKNLHGATLIPGFVDAHGHLFNTGFVAQITNLLPPPDGPGDNIQHVVDEVNRWKDSEDGKYIVKKFGWILGHGYDDSQLTEKEHPKATDLDKISKDMPVMLIHQSEHLAVLNTKALELAGYTKDTKDPEGGHIQRNADGTPNGVVEENAFYKVLFPLFKKVDAEFSLRTIKSGQDQYAANGFTTAQDGRTSPDQVGMFVNAAQKGVLYIDVAAYPDMVLSTEPMKSPYYKKGDQYTNHFRIAGVKLTLDGSPQGKTAWLTSHYHVPPAGKKEDYAGYPTMPNEKAFGYIEQAFQNKWQILAHTNGDAAIQQYLDGIANAEKEYNYSDHRTTILHGQTIRKDQLQLAEKLGVGVSLFPMHTFYWGDWHAESVLGHPRADYISPMKDAIKAGLNVTTHHDAPVTFPNSMRVLDATVNRITRSGKILGPDQRISPYDALRAMTIWSANQYFEENSKGSLAVGKRADLVILNQNPLKIDPLKINQIKVQETIKDGKTVYFLE
jgi:predicted amidohydrolase YtcJ